MKPQLKDLFFFLFILGMGIVIGYCLSLGYLCHLNS